MSKADSCAFGEGGYAVCAADEECTAEGCVKCAEACQAMECGKNPCGGLCGSCPEHFECQLGKFVYLPWCGDFKCNAPAVEDCESCPADCACDAGSVCVAGECCVQQCGSNECGQDGCGGTCGANCGAGMVCLKGTCSAAGATCDLLPIAGCCDGEKLAYCDNGILKTLDCTGYPKCGWHQIIGWYECNTDGQPDPTGEYPMSCT